MKTLEVIRNRMFWLVDAVKGRHVRKAYNDIKDIMEHYDSGESRKRREKYLVNLLDHAVSTAEFYKNFSNYSVLQDFPVINKNIIKENYNQFISDDFERSKLYAVTTSGSTGTPFTVHQDRGKRIRHVADNIYFNELANTRIGSRLYYFRIWNEINRKSPLTSWAQNVSMQETSKLPDKYIELVIQQLENDPSTKSLLAYASTFEAIGDFLLRNDRKSFLAHINMILSMSETLPNQTKKVLADYFSCPVISRYSNMENGFIAQQCLDDNEEYHINNASFLIEMLDLEKDIPVKNGELGRITVTDLFNFGMPLIRYDTGDIGITQSKPKCSFSTPVFQRIEGRKVDFILSTNGNLLSPHIVTNTMWKFPDIRQFQFTQYGIKSYSIKLNYRGGYYAKEDKIVEELKDYLGADAMISVEYVNEIPPLSSGKRKKIINLLNVN